MAATTRPQRRLPELGVLARPGGDRPPPPRATATSLFVAAPGDRPRPARYEPTINPATEEPLAEVAAGRRGRRRRRRRGRARRAAALAEAARARARQVRLPHRAPDPGARARAGHRRVARRRQADPRVARRRHPARRRALLLLRGLGRQARVRPRRAARTEPIGVVGQIVPVELPAADGRLEARARARLRQHRRAQAGRDDAADRAAAGRDLPGGRAAGRRREHPARRRARPAPRSSAIPTSTRSPSPARPRSARSIQAATAGRDIGLTLELGGKSANIVFDDAAHRPGRRGHRQRHLLQPGPRLLRRLAAAAAGERRRGGHREAVAADGAAARRRPARQEHRRRRDQLGRAAAADRGAGRRRRARGRDAPHQSPARCPTAATGSRRRCSPTSRPRTGSRVEEIFGPVVSVLTFRTQAEAIEKANATRLRARRRRLDRQGLARARRRARAEGRRRLAEHVQPVRPDVAVRRLQGERLRPRGRRWPGCGRTCG